MGESWETFALCQSFLVFIDASFIPVTECLGIIIIIQEFDDEEKHTPKLMRYCFVNDKQQGGKTKNCTVITEFDRILYVFIILSYPLQDPKHEVRQCTAYHD